MLIHLASYFYTGQSAQVVAPYVSWRGKKAITNQCAAWCSVTVVKCLIVSDVEDRSWWVAPSFDWSRENAGSLIFVTSYSVNGMWLTLEEDYKIGNGV